MNNERTAHRSESVLVGTCPANFAGAGKLMTTVIRELVKRGTRAFYVGPEVPHLYQSVDTFNPTLRLVPSVQSDAVKDSGLLYVYSLAESIVSVIEEANRTGAVTTVWGTFLFPYGHAALLAKQAAKTKGMPVRLVVSPAGSDIWQIGPQLKSISEYVLFSGDVDVRLAYTKQFADEILRLLHRTEEIKTLYPMVDLERFAPVSDAQRGVLRKQHDLGTGDFVICCHCNMRPVKRPLEVIRIAALSAAANPQRRVVLLMVGPPLGEDCPLDIPTNLIVRWPGVCGCVESWLQSSDVALNWSVHDSFNGSLMEAMACGLPVVSTDVVGIASEIGRGGGGITLNPCDVAGAARFVGHLMEHETERTAIGAAAAQHAKEVFGPNELVSRYMEVLFS